MRSLLLLLALPIAGCRTHLEDAASRSDPARPVPVENKDDAIKKDVASLQGKWVAVAAETNGREISEENRQGMGLTVKDGTLALLEAGRTHEGRFQLDPTQDPKTIDINLDGGTVRGIYRFDGAVLKLCIGLGDNDKYPTEFAGKKGRSLLVLKRASP